MNVWVDARRTLALQNVASHLGSTVQQIYFALNHPTIPIGTTASNSPGLPRSIDNYCYTGNATIRAVGPTPGSGQVLEITVQLVTAGITATTSVILGSNAQWNQTSVFKSNSASPCIYANKTQTSIQLYFGG